MANDVILLYLLCIRINKNNGQWCYIIIFIISIRINKINKNNGQWCYIIIFIIRINKINKNNGQWCYIIIFIIVYINIEEERGARKEEDVVVLALVILLWINDNCVLHSYNTTQQKQWHDDAQTDVPTFRIKYGSFVSITIAYVSVLLAPC